MAQHHSLIGYGEAGRTFATAAGWAAGVRVFDAKTDAPHLRGAMLADYSGDNVTGAETAQAALHGSAAIICLVTADQALAAATAAAAHIADGALYFDMNSVAPSTKRAASMLIGAAGGRYVDTAIMAPVIPAALSVPLLLSGPHADAGAAALRALGFANASVVAGDVGRAASIKMIRSVMIKGQEALIAEMMQAAQADDVVDEVLGSLGEGWAARAEYSLDRMRLHGRRRAAEMEEVARTLTDLGVDPVMTRAAIIRQTGMAA